MSDSKTERDSVDYLSIYCDGEDRPLSDALGRITTEWVENGESTQQTVIDLARACRALRHALSRIAEFGEENEVSMELDGDEIAVHSVSIAKHAIRDR